MADEFIYDPSTSQTIQDLPAGDTVTDTVTYTITDGKDGFDTATITYTVTSPNDGGNTPPDAVDDHEGTVPGDDTTTTTAADILGNDSDPDGDDIEIISLDGTSELGATITPVDTDGDGEYDEFIYDPSTSQTIQDLPAGETITDTVTYTISDGNGGTDTATISYVVTSPNDCDDNSVVAEDDHLDVTVSNDEAAEGSTSILLANDYDPEGDNFTITAADATSSLGASVSLVDSNGDGVFDKISYDPTTSDQLSDLDDGECLTDSFTYTITDENGATDTATVFLTVEGTEQDNGGGCCHVVETSCWGGSWGSWSDLFDKDFVNEGTTDGMDWKDAFDVMGCDTDSSHDHSDDDMSDCGKDIYDDAKDCVDDSHWDHHHDGHHNDC